MAQRVGGRQASQAEALFAVMEEREQKPKKTKSGTKGGPQPLVEPSAEEEAKARRADPPSPYPDAQAVGRFNYWHFPTVNPWGDPFQAVIDALGVDPWNSRQALHLHDEETYGNRHRVGDSDAIFEYVKGDPWAFRSHWVVEQMETWRGNGDVSSWKKLMTKYASAKGKTSSDRLRDIIRRDQQIFRDVLKRYRPRGQVRRGPRDPVFAEVAERHGMGEDSVKLVYDNYINFHDAQVPARWTRAQFFSELTKMLSRIAVSG